LALDEERSAEPAEDESNDPGSGDGKGDVDPSSALKLGTPANSGAPKTSCDANTRPLLRESLLLDEPRSSSLLWCR
jgi:hypothetical protein